MTVKQYLSQAYTATQKIVDIREQVVRLREEMTRLGRSISEDTRVQVTRQRDPMGDRVADILDKIDEREKLLARLEDVIFTVETALNRIECVTSYRVLHAHYVRGLKMREIAQELNYSNSYVYALHREGLEKIGEF